MEHSSSTSNRQVRIPTIAWILGLGLIAALAAIFVFEVPVSTVAYAALFIFMMGSHLFMHGSHGGHGSHGQGAGSTADVDGPAKAAQSGQDEQSRHSGGCH